MLAVCGRFASFLFAPLFFELRPQLVCKVGSDLLQARRAQTSNQKSMLGGPKFGPQNWVPNLDPIFWAPNSSPIGTLS